MKVDTTSSAVQFFPAAKNKLWTGGRRELPNGSYYSPHMHVLIFHDDGVLYAAPRPAEERFTSEVEENLAMAGVRVGKVPTPSSERPGEACVLLDESQIQLAVETLNAAGADVAVTLHSPSWDTATGDAETSSAMEDDTTCGKFQRFPSANPKPWEECDGLDGGGCYSHEIHIVIFHDDGVLYATPECGQGRFAPTAAGHLALAGVRIENPPVTSSVAQGEGCVLLDEGQIELAVETLNAAGADVTVHLDSQP